MENLYDDQEFWAMRVAKAKEDGVPHLSLYVGEWESRVEARKKVVEKYIPPDQTVLDAGCGYGWMSQEIPNPYCGIDQSHALIEYGKELYPDVELYCTKLEDLDISIALSKYFGGSPTTFDWVVCSGLKWSILECEKSGSMEKGKWERIESNLRSITKNLIIWPQSTEVDVYEVYENGR